MRRWIKLNECGRISCVWSLWTDLRCFRCSPAEGFCLRDGAGLIMRVLSSHLRVRKQWDQSSGWVGNHISDTPQPTAAERGKKREKAADQTDYVNATIHRRPPRPPTGFYLELISFWGEKMFIYQQVLQRNRQQLSCGNELKSLTGRFVDLIPRQIRIRGV